MLDPPLISTVLIIWLTFYQYLPKDVEYLSMTQKFSDSWLIEKYLYYGSVDLMFKHEEVTPFSYSDVYRKLDEYGIVKSAGRHTNLWECLDFFELYKLSKKPSIRRIYQSMPRGIETSATTLHRILKSVKDGVLHRKATALIVKNQSGSILVSKEMREDNFGKLTIPVTYSRLSESWQESVMRVLQQEVYPKSTSSGLFKGGDARARMLESAKKFECFSLLDVELGVFEVSAHPTIYPESGRTTEHKFMQMDEIVSLDRSLFRPGVYELISFMSHTSHAQRLVLHPINLALKEMEPSLQLA